MCGNAHRCCQLIFRLVKMMRLLCNIICLACFFVDGCALVVIVVVVVVGVVVVVDVGVGVAQPTTTTTTKATAMLGKGHLQVLVT